MFSKIHATSITCFRNPLGDCAAIATAAGFSFSSSFNSFALSSMSWPWPLVLLMAADVCRGMAVEADGSRPTSIGKGVGFEYLEATA